MKMITFAVFIISKNDSKSLNYQHRVNWVRFTLELNIEFLCQNQVYFYWLKSQTSSFVFISTQCLNWKWQKCLILDSIADFWCENSNIWLEKVTKFPTMYLDQINGFLVIFKYLVHCSSLINLQMKRFFATFSYQLPSGIICKIKQKMQ